MKRKTDVRLRILTGALMLLVISFVVGNGRLANSQTADEAAVRETLLMSASSFAKNNIAGATKAWANDESLTIFENGHANYGWVDYRDNHLIPK